MRAQHERTAPDRDALLAGIAGPDGEALVAMNHLGLVVEFDRAAELMFGYAREEVVGRHLDELIIPPLLREAHRAGFHRFLTKGDRAVAGRRLEAIAMRSDRSEFPVEVTIAAVPGPDGSALFVGIIRDLTESNRIRHELERINELHHLVLDYTQDLISLVDASGVICYVSPSHQRVMGYSEDELLGANVLEFVHPEDAAMVAERMAGSVASGQSGFVSEIRMRHRDGHWLILEGHGNIIQRQGEPPIILASARDVTERKRAEEALTHLAAIVESSDDAIYSKSLDGVILSWNPGAERLYGYTPEEAIGRPLSMLIPPDRPMELDEMLGRLRAGDGIEHYETERLRKNGSRVHVSLSVSPIRDGNGRIVASTAIARDITDRKRAEEQIAFLAYHDKLTGLPNRARFDELLAMGLARARRHGVALAVLYLDLDDFKDVNDTLGHVAGDELLRQLGQRLVAASRDTDSVARMGGDEFMVLVPDLVLGGKGSTGWLDAPVAVAQTVADRIHDSLRHPFSLAGTPVSVTASIGVSIFPFDAHDARTLFRNADTAMYQSKRSGPGRSAFAGAASTT